MIVDNTEHSDEEQCTGDHEQGSDHHSLLQCSLLIIN